MAFLELQKKNETARVINELIAQADSQITSLAAIRVSLLGWQSTLAGNLTDFTNADRTEFNAELSRLNNRINSEL